MAHQAKAGRVGLAQVGGVHIGLAGAGAQQLAFVEAAFRVHLCLVAGKGGDFLVRQKLQLGDANAVFAGNDAVERARQRHDAGHRLVRGLQHHIVVAVDGNVGVHVAVPGVHVQRHPHPALEHALVDGVAFLQDRAEGSTGEEVLQRPAQLGLPAGAQGVVLQLQEQGIALIEPALPQRPHLGNQGTRLLHPLFEHLGHGHVGGIVTLAQRQLALGKKGVQLVAQGNLVAQRQFDVDALDAVGVLGHARQRNHHVFIDLEGVGVTADGRRALAIEPEFLARLGADGNEAFSAARVGQAHHFRRGAGHGVSVVAGDVPHQHHLG